MDKLIYDYLRILDIDPLGDFIRLINISQNQSLDLRNIIIRQYQSLDFILNIYKFNNEIKSLLHSREVVTIYSQGSNKIKFNIEPYLFLGYDIRQWLINNNIQTEISLNNIIIDNYKFYSFSSNDIPNLFLNYSIDNSENFTKKIIFNSYEYKRFVYPYCLSNNNIVNPHTWGILNENQKKFQRKLCYKNNKIIIDFNSYPRRLTTSPSQ